MSTEFFNDQWRIPSNENQNKISNYSMDFDGTSDKIEFGNVNSFERTDSFSLSCWVNLDSISTQFLLSKMPNSSPFRGYILYIVSGKLQFSFNANYPSDRIQVNSVGTISAGSWNHLAFTYDGSSSRTGVKLYINSVEQSVTFDGPVSVSGSTINTADFQISGRGTSSLADGKIDQVSVFDYELSETQISQLGAAEGYAFRFNSNRIDVGLESALGLGLGGSSKYSTSIWFNKSSLNSSTAMWGYNYGDNIGSGFYYWWVGGDLRVAVGKNGISSGFAYYTISSGLIPIGTWQHVVMVFDGTQTGNDRLKVYQNGVVATGTYTNTSAFPETLPTGNGASDRKVYLGQLQLGNGSFGFNFDGKLSNVQQWDNTALTLGNATTLYNNGSPLKTLASIPENLNLEAWWKLDNTATLSGSTWSIPDASANSNTGTSFGMTASSLVGTNINGELVGNPMGLSPKPVSYYQLGDQSVDNVANFLVPNNSLQDYVFETSPSGAKRFNIPSLPIASAATISIWFNPQTLVNGTLFGGPSTGLLRLTGQNATPPLVKIVYCANNSCGVLTTNITVSTFLNKWHHIALVQDGGVATVYIDNVNKGVLSGTLRTPSFTNIGSENSASVFDGFVSNAATFTTNLPATGTQSIASLYNNGSPPDLASYSNLQRWYKLNAADTFNGTNWTIKDYAGSSNGTSVGMDSSNLVVSDLQHTSGYSPYALSFAADDSIEIPTNTNLEITGNITISAWIKSSSSSTNSTKIINKRNASSSNFDFFLDTGGSKLKFFDGTNNIASDITITLGIWNHVAITIQSAVTNGSNFYINGNGQATNLPTFTIASNTAPLVIGANFTRNGTFFNGDISNVSIFNYNLSPAEITEIYNQGVPSNLNTFSGTAPVGWWQLGSNSSFSTDWTVLDEIGTSNGVSTSMTNDDIVNGPGYSANGLGTSSIDIIGDAPYSAANGLSENMDVLDRVSGTGNVPG